MGLVMRTEFQRTQQEYRMKTFGLSACMVAVVAFAADPPMTTTLYKSIGPDGKTIYSDRPPGEGNSAKTLTFRNLPSSPLSASTLAYIEQLGKPNGSMPFSVERDSLISAQPGQTDELANA